MYGLSDLGTGLTIGSTLLGSAEDSMMRAARSFPIMQSRIALHTEILRPEIAIRTIIIIVLPDVPNPVLARRPAARCLVISLLGLLLLSLLSPTHCRLVSSRLLV